LTLGLVKKPKENARVANDAKMILENFVLMKRDVVCFL